MTYKMPVHLRDNFTYKYTPSKKSLDSLIFINGYYTTIEINHRRIPKGFSGQRYETVIDTFYMNYLFFDDGIMIRNMFSSEQTSDTTDMPDFLARMAKDTTNSLKLWGTWGTYIVSNGIIKTQTIHASGALNYGRAGWETHFKILHQKTIKLIYTKPIHFLSPSDKKIYTEQFYQERIKDEKPAIFIKSEAIPNSDCWMKKERWFWENEKDYNEFMSKNSG
jgi:hypothetical protein